MYVLLALLALGLLLAVHELGHLLAARLLGVSVPRFSLGFGPPLLSFRLFGTECVIAAIPLGASATLHGMNPHVPGLEPTDPRSYSAQRPWRRVAITLAGSVANYLFALGVLFALYISGTHVVVPLTVGTVTPGSEAARAQLLPGDRIVNVDGLPVKTWSEGRVTLLGDAAHPMYPVGSNGASQAILDARCLADALARSEHPRQALMTYQAQRLPMTAEVVRSNRRGGPEGVIDAVEQLAPDGFDNIDNVLSYAQREAIVRGYASKAGFATVPGPGLAAVRA